MELDSLHALYVEELKDLYSAENQILKALPKMIKAASHKELKQAFTTHERQTRGHVARLERIFKELDESPRGKKCVGMEGVIEDGAELIKEKPEPEVLDAGLIAAAQHVEHYEMAGYGTVRTWAEKMGHERQAELLQETLDEEKETDQLLTRLAESTINVEAAEADATETSDRGRSVQLHREPSSGKSSGKRGGKSSSKQSSARGSAGAAWRPGDSMSEDVGDEFDSSAGR